MGKTLVLTEKPSVARDIAKVLNCNQKSDGYLSGAKYIITWALGHLVTLAEPEAYGGKYKTWNLEDLPMIPDKMQLVVIKETSKQFGIVRSLMNKAEIDELIIATDAGREGELVARWIIEKATFRKPIKRLWISSQTDKSIKDGFANLKPGREYESLYMSARCRAEADWLVGLNTTRALTCKYNAQLSAGRVQTPTLAIIVERENEIRRFVPVDFWTTVAKVNGFNLNWQDKKTGQGRMFDKKQAEDIALKINGQTGDIVELKKEAKNEQQPLLYDLTELQRDANRKFGYSAKKTLNITQKLYESHKFVTYPRTDSRYITQDIVPTLTERLKSINVGPYAAFVPSILRQRINASRRFVDDSKVTDHHALIPTEQAVNLGDLNTEERNVFDLIARRFLAVLYPAYEYEQTTVKVSVNGEILHAKGNIVKSYGWKAVYQDRQDDAEDLSDEDKIQSLPELKRGDKLKIISSKVINGKTKPPARYNEATLLTAMEHPGKFIDNLALRETMEKGSGLGTPATRADIIEKLFDSFYVERNGKDIYPTSKGVQLIDIVPSDLKSPELTAKWEQKLGLIGRSKASPVEFIKEMKVYAGKLVSVVIASTHKYTHENATREKCPECGKNLLDVKGKKGKMLVCPDRECSYRKSVTKTSNARCPECHKAMEIRGEGDKMSFYCGCGYREKMEDFKKRKSERVDKKDVSSFLNNQNKDESINSVFADALSKIKLR